MKKLLLLFPLLLLTLSACDNGVERKSTLGWCIWEISKHENYDNDFSYIYERLYNHEAEIEKGGYGYYITVFTEDRIGEWFCMIKVKRVVNSITDSIINLGGGDSYKREDVVWIDCDLAREELLWING